MNEITNEARGIAENVSFQQTRQFYEDSVIAFHQADERADEVAYYALQNAMCEAHTALCAVIDAHCARQIALALQQRHPKECVPTMQTPVVLVDSPTQWERILNEARAGRQHLLILNGPGASGLMIATERRQEAGESA